ncbi:Cof-type HAD-IIB family hydrolase [Actomonas aquatica]|uniref:HAD family hydrolase n=1 Tax=Actomonas aquatica TaxID=2866162 RepID=A0ABZ1C3K4_9BACT|nr:HAD family hydrolase [Opitutus sp. WL0086]WRQ85940.1 HAD family hydrolase [Opitutus sp. WL0086]
MHRARIKTNTPAKYLAAIDLDGTLLGAHATVSAENRTALETLVARGFEVVLASGRHPANMAEIARDLPMVQWMVACQGCEVADVARERVLEQWVLPEAVALRIAEAGRAQGFGVVAYAAEGEVAPWPTEGVAGYEAISKTQVKIIGEEAFKHTPLLKVVWVAPMERLDAMIEAGGVLDLADGIYTVRSHERVFEFMPNGITKATGVARLARELGIGAEAVVGFGDADNDLPLFGWAGCSVAMPEARPHVRAGATFTAPAGDQATAFARGVEVLLANLPPGLGG